MNKENISEADLNDFLQTRSDFAFELRVLRSLCNLGFECEHGWSYEDPITGKPRQFDLRAIMQEAAVSFFLSVECKNVGADSPLLIHTVPRSTAEAFHEVVHAFSLPTNTIHMNGTPHAFVDRIKGSGIYPPGFPVGKSAVQVSRPKGVFKATDNDFYDKWAQALSSANDLFDRAAHPRLHPGRHDSSCALVLPVLVVPDGMIWQVDYDKFGNLIEKPRKVERCSFFVNRKYTRECQPDNEEVTLSHIEFATLSGLEARLVDLMNDLHGDVFPDATFERLQRHKIRIRG